MSVAQTTRSGLEKLVFLVSIFGCIIIISLSCSISSFLWIDYDWTQTLLMNPIVYGLFALGWLLIILGLVTLGLGRRPNDLERLITPTTSIYNCGCMTGVPILFGLLIGMLYQVTPVGNPLEYFLPLPYLTMVGMIILGIAFIIHNDRLMIGKYALYLGLFFIAVGGGTLALIQTGMLSMSTGLVLWLVVVSGLIFTFPLLVVFFLERHEYQIGP